MPIIQFNLLEGRTTEQKRRLCAAVTDTVVEVLGVRREQVRILINTLPPENYAVAGVTVAERPLSAGNSDSSGRKAVAAGEGESS